MIAVKARKASNKDPRNSVTYRTSEFPFEFKNGHKYLIQLDTDDLILVKATRNASTLYSGKIEHPITVPVPLKTGERLSHNVVRIFTIKDL